MKKQKIPKKAKILCILPKELKKKAYNIGIKNKNKTKKNFRIKTIGQNIIAYTK